ncbi:hypothetical protein ACFY9H_04170 [Streptomyces bacillaris]|uniref:Uncharacterized protein n=1 Tax=Streptomyces cavourensis TaxID=67258 RepID=A0AAD0Q716_9ACTN|nr:MULTISPECIES: hypothetical protein [Streptomyces]MYR36522.1 hypothetical protein [Streptomyces sp. SID4944]NUW23140.1 hypothetical protein [Streptomyces roseoviolaceus]ATY97493.1 hypothetical protein CVT27_20145 [Streptomyces cavourensis]AXI73315.1 hypothetical protein DTW94_20180 [Streptomyces cavourensis]MBH0245295.1 hypothetical protein [Streptomyces cavourensis]
MTTASLPRKTSRTEPAATAPAVAAPQHHGLFLEPHFAPGSRALDDDEYEDGDEGDAEPARPARRR